MFGSSSRAHASESPIGSEKEATTDTQPSTVGSEHGDLEYPYVPEGTRKYLLLCANSSVHRISLVHIDVTNMNHDEVLFRQIRNEYAKLRGLAARNPFLVPRTMHYIKVSRVTQPLSCKYIVNPVSFADMISK